MISVWDKILKLESALLSSDKCLVPPRFEAKESVVSVGNFSIDFTDIRREMDKGLKLLATGHGIVLQKRRDQLKGVLDPKFHSLLKPSNPVTSELLGDNVDQKIAESTKLSEAAQKLHLKRPFHFVNYTQHHGSGNNPRTHTYCASFGWRPYFTRGRRQSAAPYRGGNFFARADYHAHKRGRFHRGHSTSPHNSQRYSRRK